MPAQICFEGNIFHIRHSPGTFFAGERYILDSRQYITSPIDPRHYCPLNPNHPSKSKQSIYTSLCVTHNEPVYANPQNSFYFRF
jgi:hypothetical protein